MQIRRLMGLKDTAVSFMVSIGDGYFHIDRLL
jgi:hypothetical protein